MFVGLINIFFWKVSVYIFHPFLNGFVCFISYKSALVLCRFWIFDLCQMGRLQKFFSHSVGCRFTLMIIYFAVQKLWSLTRSHLSILAFVANAFGVSVMKSFPMSMPWMVLPRFSSRVFMVLCPTFKTLIHLQLILVLGVRKGFSFCFVHITSQFSQHHLLNRESFPHCLFCHVSQRSDGYFWGLCSVPLVYISLWVPVPCCFGYCSL